MKPIPDISRRSVLRALTASAAVAFAVAATGSAAAAAPWQVAATPEAGTQAQGHRHLIGVL
ncbi:hypothetical protein J2Y41_001171 [Arthrobacter sp. 1088]|uniref:hypothetical protein n=1 Tax=Arthrobacter sp. 1088 TaxID=2817768 RepID=UPI002855DD2F|nr:hypothetical protein [Arthrobacter sp. 1088]MDR6685616.1 hypothetical protein [Arthrobacter sp. 1088]